MDEICGAALRETDQGRAPATADGGNILAEQTEAGKRLNCHLEEASFFRIPSRPGEPCPTRMLCRTAVEKTFGLNAPR